MRRLRVSQSLLGRTLVHTRSSTPGSRRQCHHDAIALSLTPTLKSWDLEDFRRQAFVAETPWRLPRDNQHLPAACRQWFTPDGDFDDGPPDLNHVPNASELRTAFWAAYESTNVPLELTAGLANDAANATFHRTMAPLRLLLTFLAKPSSSSEGSLTRDHSIYLAQCPLPSLPPALRAAVPTPELVEQAGKGDIYDSSLWLGRPPTYTPLHRDPNPNFFIQLAGRKVVRLIPPEIGDAVFARVQEACRSQVGSKTVRGEEMMVGHQRQLLEAAIWGTGLRIESEEAVSEISSVMRKFGQEAELGLGEALFIPKGWWHSVKGVGEGITASVNWWFR